MSSRDQDGGSAEAPKRPVVVATTRPAEARPTAGAGGSGPPRTPGRVLGALGTNSGATGPVARAVTRTDEEATDPISRLRRFFQEVRSEILKVSWPTPIEARNLTLVVLGLTALVGLILGLFDVLLAEAVRWLTTGGV